MVSDPQFEWPGQDANCHTMGADFEKPTNVVGLNKSGSWYKMAGAEAKTGRAMEWRKTRAAELQEVAELKVQHAPIQADFKNYAEQKCIQEKTEKKRQKHQERRRKKQEEEKEKGRLIEEARQDQSRVDWETQLKHTVLKVETERQKAQEATDTMIMFKQLIIAQVQVPGAKLKSKQEGMSQRDWNQLLRDDCMNIAEESPEMAKRALQMVKKMDRLDPHLDRPHLHLGRGLTSLGAQSSFVKVMKGLKATAPAALKVMKK